MNRLLIGRGLLGVGGALNIVSMLLPWEDPNNHYYKVTFDTEFFLSCARDGAWLDGLRLLAEGLGCISPSVLGCILLLGALLPRGRTNLLVSATLHVALLGTLAVVAAILFVYDYGDEGADRRLLMAAGGGALLFAALAFAEFRVALRSVRRAGGSGDAVHVLPLILFLLVGTVLAIVLHGSEVWHSQDYGVIAAGSLIGLVGVCLRRSRGAPVNQPD